MTLATNRYVNWAYLDIPESTEPVRLRGTEGKYLDPLIDFYHLPQKYVEKDGQWVAIKSPAMSAMQLSNIGRAIGTRVKFRSDGIELNEEMESTETKVCKGCRRVLPVSKFYRTGKSKNESTYGKILYRPQCIECFKREASK